MENGVLRPGKPDEFLSSVMANAPEPARSLGGKLFGIGEARNSSNAVKLLKEAASASADEVAALAGAGAPSLGDSIGRAWQWLERFPITTAGWTIGEPAEATNRAIWLRDLLREIARYELPTKQDDALLWLAIHCGVYAESEPSELAAIMAALLGGISFQLGTTGCDHVGRLLASEIAQGNRISEDLLDTLRLVGTGRHPALPPEKRFVPSPHVARGLAGCGREEAIEALCETITANRDSSESSVSAVAQAVTAAAEVFTVFPNVLPSVLETVAGVLSEGSLERESLAKQLEVVLGLPAPLVAEPGGDSVLRTCATALSDPDRRQQMIAGDDDGELFLAFWTEAAIDIDDFGKRLLERYDRACADHREDTKLLLRTFARMRQGRTLAMRPLWLRMLAESLGDSPDQLNIALVAEALNFGAASGVYSGSDQSVRNALPADEAFGKLVEIEKRLQNESLMAELVKLDPTQSAETLHRSLVKLIVANSTGRPAEALFAYVRWLDYDSIGLLADADFAKTNAETRAAIFSRHSTNDPSYSKMIARAVAAADSIDELLDRLERFRYSIDPLFAIACALRAERTELWRQLLLASKKDKRGLGLELVTTTLQVIDGTGKFEESKILANLPSDIIVDGDAIRRDVSTVLDEYEAAQSKKKNGDDLTSRLFIKARELARTDEESEKKAAEEQAAVARLCERVAEITGIDRNRFVPTRPEPPRDRGSSYVDLLGEVAPKLVEAAARLMAEFDAQSIDLEEQKARLQQWFESRGQELRTDDGSEMLRLHHWFRGPGDWSSFDSQVLKQAQASMSPDQSRRIAELRPPELKVRKRGALQGWFLMLRWEAKYRYEEILLAQLDWYESVLANLPESFQRLGPLAQVVTPHPPHSRGIADLYMSVGNWLRSREYEEARKTQVRQRLWPLLWWTASFGGGFRDIDAPAMGTAVSHGLASLADLVWFLVQPDYRQTAGNLVQAVEHPEKICLAINAQRDAEIRAVVDAVADVCREQEKATDPSLPATLASTWPRLPAPKGRSGLRDILTKYAHVAYQSQGRTDDEQKAFVARVRESLEEAEKDWIIEGEEYWLHRVDFEKLDAWRRQTTEDLRKLFEERILTEDTLLRIGLHHPVLMRSVLDATGRSHQLEAAIWILAHDGSGLTDLAITLDADTGYAGLRRPGAVMDEIGERLVSHHAPGVAKQDGSGYWPTSDATVRRSWKRAAIDCHPRKDLQPLLKALKAVTPPASRLRVEGLLDAMDGQLNSPAKRTKLESSIKDRPNLALLQLAVMPLPEGREELVKEISRRLKIFEGLAITGRKRKSSGARETMRRALDQARRTLADNAGLADPTQLDWISGEAIAKELAEFERLEAGDYVIQLRLRGDGPHVLVTKSGKSMKSIPAAFKSSEKGKRLTELQSRLKTALRDARAVLEESMVKQRSYLPDELKMMMKHPVVAAVASELVFIMDSKTPDEPAAVGLPSEDGEQLIGLDGKGTKVAQDVHVAHPLELDALGMLTAWKSLLTDRPPQPFQQVERAIVHAADLETADEGKCVVRHDGVTITNRDQAFRILQAHGWQDHAVSHELCRSFSSAPHKEIVAILSDFMGHLDSIGPLEFRDTNWKKMLIVEVPPIILSEAIRDIDRTVAGASG